MPENLVSLEQESPDNIQSEKEPVLFKQTIVRGLNTAKAALNQSAAASVVAEKIAVEQSAVGALSTDLSNLKQSAVGLNSSIEVSAAESTIGVSFSSIAEVDRSNVGLLAAREVRAGSIKTGILLAGEVEGPVETTLDTRQTLLFGIIVGATIGLILTIGRQFSRR